MFKGNVYSLCLGFKTDWFEQIDFITFIREDYNDNQVCHHATMLFKAFRKKENKQRSLK